MEIKTSDFEEEEEDELDDENIQQEKDTNFENNNSSLFEEDEEQEYFDIFSKDKSDDDLYKNRNEYRNVKMNESKLAKVEEEEEEDEEEGEKEEEKNIQKYQEEEEEYDDNNIKYQEQIDQLILKMQKEIEKKDIDVQEKENNDDIYKEEEEEKEQNDDSTNFLNVSSVEIESKKSNKLLKILMNTINSIGYKKFHFDDISEACQIENFVKFLKILIKDDESFLENLINNEKRTYSQKMRKIINFLGEKKAIFKILQFDFKDPNLIVPSSILLYMKILDLFFLKRSKSEMLDFCESLLFTEIDEDDTLYKLSLKIKKNPMQRNKILYDWNTYLALVYYANEGNIHFKREKIPLKKYSFKTKQIPKIIDGNFFEQKDINSSPIYYQLQFIFDEIENNNDSNKSSSDANNKAKKKIEYSLESENEIIETFKNRIKMKSLKLSQKMQQKNVGSKPKAEEYWSKNDDKSLFKTGIFYFAQEKQLDLWNDAFDNCIITEITSKTMEFISNNTYFKSENYKLFKLFVYNDSEWQINVNEFDYFKKIISQYQVKKPLVLLFDSKKSILKSLYSNLAYPYKKFTKKDGLDQIFVYALYGKPLEIKKKVFLKNIVESFNPIYLLLHVPKSKKNLKNLNTIIYRIYYFLCAICDIEVVVLDKNYYNDQIYLVNKFNKIFLSYKNSIISVKETKNRKHISIDKSSKNISSDGDETEEEEENNEEDDENNEEEEEENNEEEEDENNEEEEEENNINGNDDLVNEIASINNLDIFDKTPNCIFLVNNNQIDDGCKGADNTQFFENIKNKIKNSNSYFHFINVKKPSTYFEFITTLRHLFSNCTDCTNERSFEKLRLNELANISNYYIQYKLGINLNVPLKSMIYNRFSQFKKYNYSFKSDLFLLTQLWNEIIKSCPPIDVEYKGQCNSIISDIKDKLIKKYQDVIVDQLQISAEKSICYWEMKINERYHWPVEDRNNMRSKHGNFLKSEYFDIISEIFQPKDFSHVFNGNYSVLTDQIKSDNLKFVDLFKKFDNKILNENNQQKVENIEDLRYKATNYMIREKENISEKIVTVESDKFDEIFETDF